MGLYYCLDFIGTLTEALQFHVMQRLINQMPENERLVFTADQ